MKRRILSTWLAISIMLVPTSGAFAMTAEERIAALEERVLKLEEEIQLLLPKGNDNETIDDTIEEKVQETVLMRESWFLKDIVDSYNARSVVANRYSNAEQNAMTHSEYVSYCVSCAEAERPLYEKYQNAVFDDLNIQYLCKQYITGLEKQYQSKEVWEKSGEYEKFDELYMSGYYNRAYVIVELAEYYDAAFGDISSMKENVRLLDSTNDAEKRNSQVPRELVIRAQQGLNDIGFFCGTVDGVAGKRTVKSIKRFQEMYGYPIDGMIDEELIEQLDDALLNK